MKILAVTAPRAACQPAGPEQPLNGEKPPNERLLQVNRAAAE